MSSVASHVYTRLGIGELETWTELKRVQSTLQERLAKEPSNKEEVLEALARQLGEVTTRVREIEHRAGVENNNV